MGDVLSSCTCKIDCCDKNKVNLETDMSQEEESEKSDEYDDDDNQDFLDIENKDTKKSFNFPSDVINMKVKAKPILEHNTNPWSVYKELEQIGSGTYGIVKKVCLKNNPEIIRALKIIPKDRLIQGLDDVKLSEEILILKNLDHPNIMKIFEFYVDEKNFYMVSEYCDQGDLYGKIRKLFYMNEIVVKFLMEQIFNAVAYLHSKHVFHGDIKLENIMLYSTTKYTTQRFTIINKRLSDDIDLQKEINNSYNNKIRSQKSLQLIKEMLNYEIKLIDFGCSKILKKKGERKSGIIGTSMYCSPEVVNNLYDEKCDEWSCGVLMYVLLCGEPPFKGDTEEEIFKKIKINDYNFEPKPFKYVSKNCIDLITKLLEPNIHRRIKAIDALKHPFFTENFNLDKALTQNKDLSLIRKMSEIKMPFSKFHEAVTSYMCSNYISKDEEKKLRAVFRYIDDDRKNYLTKAKIEQKLKENGHLLTSEKIQSILDAFDLDTNGIIEYQEYLTGLCDKKLLFQDINLKRFFDVVDTDKKGYLTSKDITNFAFQNKKINEEATKEYLKQFGMKIDDKLFFDDFAYIMQNNCSLDSKQNNKENNLKEIKSVKFENIDIYEDLPSYKKDSNQNE